MELAGREYKLGAAGPTYNSDGGIDPNGQNTGAAAPKNVINGSEFPTIVMLEFGTVGYLCRAVVPPCIAAGIPTYLVHIPAANVYDGVAPVPAGPAGGFVLDLYSLQQYILTLPVP